MTILELDDVHKRFGGMAAVDGVSLGVDEGEILALVGPNGAGKSTLLKAISGMQPATSGTITFGGNEITSLKAHQVRQRGIAMVLQTPRVFESMTVAENAIIGATFGRQDERPSEAEARSQALEALDFVGLSSYANVEVGQLNLHQQRFLELARALAGKPRVLLLDEVMAGLNDSELQASIEIVRTIRNELGVTVVWVEHVMKAVMNLAERIVVLNFGRLLADGEPNEVMTNPEVVEAYLGVSGTGAK